MRRWYWCSLSRWFFMSRMALCNQFSWEIWRWDMKARTYPGQRFCECSLSSPLSLLGLLDGSLQRHVVAIVDLVIGRSRGWLLACSDKNEACRRTWVGFSAGHQSRTLSQNNSKNTSRTSITPCQASHFPSMRSAFGSDGFQGSKTNPEPTAG